MKRKLSNILTYSIDMAQQDIDNDDLDMLDPSVENNGDGTGEMYEHFRFVADKGQQLLRVDKCAAGGRSRVHTRKRESGKIKLSRKTS